MKAALLAAGLLLVQDKTPLAVRKSDEAVTITSAGKELVRYQRTKPSGLRGPPRTNPRGDRASRGASACPTVVRLSAGVGQFEESARRYSPER